MRSLRHVLTAGVIACCFAITPVQASAAEPHKATVAIDIVLASKEAGATDPRLAKFRSQFSDFAYKSFKLVGSRLITVDEKKSTQVTLAGGHKLKVTFTKAESNGRARLKLQVPGILETTVSLARDGSVVVGGPALPSGNGVLFVPVTLVVVK